MHRFRHQVLSWLIGKITTFAEVSPEDISSSITSGTVTLNNVRLRTSVLNSFLPEDIYQIFELTKVSVGTLSVSFPILAYDVDQPIEVVVADVVASGSIRVRTDASSSTTTTSASSSNSINAASFGSGNNSSSNSQNDINVKATETALRRFFGLSLFGSSSSPLNNNDVKFGGYDEDEDEEEDDTSGGEQQESSPSTTGGGVSGWIWGAVSNVTSNVTSAVSSILPPNPTKRPVRVSLQKILVQVKAGMSVAEARCDSVVCKLENSEATTSVCVQLVACEIVVNSSSPTTTSSKTSTRMISPPTTSSKSSFLTAAAATPTLVTEQVCRFVLSATINSIVQKKKGSSSSSASSSASKSSKSENVVSSPFPTTTTTTKKQHRKWNVVVSEMKGSITDDLITIFKTVQDFGSELLVPIYMRPFRPFLFMHLPYAGEEAKKQRARGRFLYAIHSIVAAIQDRNKRWQVKTTTLREVRFTRTAYVKMLGEVYSEGATQEALKFRVTDLANLEVAIKHNDVIEALRWLALKRATELHVAGKGPSVPLPINEDNNNIEQQQQQQQFSSPSSTSPTTNNNNKSISRKQQQQIESLYTASISVPTISISLPLHFRASVTALNVTLYSCGFLGKGTGTTISANVGAAEIAHVIISSSSSSSASSSSLKTTATSSSSSSQKQQQNIPSFSLRLLSPLMSSSSSTSTSKNSSALQIQCVIPKRVLLSGGRIVAENNTTNSTSISRTESPTTTPRGGSNSTPTFASSSFETLSSRAPSEVPSWCSTVTSRLHLQGRRSASAGVLELSVRCGIVEVRAEVLKLVANQIMPKIEDAKSDLEKITFMQGISTRIVMLLSASCRSKNNNNNNNKYDDDDENKKPQQQQQKKKPVKEERKMMRKKRRSQSPSSVSPTSRSSSRGSSSVSSNDDDNDTNNNESDDDSSSVSSISFQSSEKSATAASSTSFEQQQNTNQIPSSSTVLPAHSASSTLFLPEVDSFVSAQKPATPTIFRFDLEAVEIFLPEFASGVNIKKIRAVLPDSTFERERQIQRQEEFENNDSNNNNNTSSNDNNNNNNQKEKVKNNKNNKNEDVVVGFPQHLLSLVTICDVAQFKVWHGPTDLWQSKLLNAKQVPTQSEIVSFQVASRSSTTIMNLVVSGVPSISTSRGSSKTTNAPEKKNNNNSNTTFIPSSPALASASFYNSTGFDLDTGIPVIIDLSQEFIDAAKQTAVKAFNKNKKKQKEEEEEEEKMDQQQQQQSPTNKTQKKSSSSTSSGGGISARFGVDLSLPVLIIKMKVSEKVLPGAIRPLQMKIIGLNINVPPSIVSSNNTTQQQVGSIFLNEVEEVEENDNYSASKQKKKKSKNKQTSGGMLTTMMMLDVSLDSCSIELPHAANVDVGRVVVSVVGEETFISAEKFAISVQQQSPHAVFQLAAISRASIRLVAPSSPAKQQEEEKNDENGEEEEEEEENNDDDHLDVAHPIQILLTDVTALDNSVAIEEVGIHIRPKQGVVTYPDRPALTSDIYVAVALSYVDIPNAMLNPSFKILGEIYDHLATMIWDMMSLEEKGVFMSALSNFHVVFYEPSASAANNPFIAATTSIGATSITTTAPPSLSGSLNFNTTDNNNNFTTQNQEASPSPACRAASAASFKRGTVIRFGDAEARVTRWSSSEGGFDDENFNKNYNYNNKFGSHDSMMMKHQYNSRRRKKQQQQQEKRRTTQRSFPISSSSSSASDYFDSDSDSYYSTSSNSNTSFENKRENSDTLLQEALESAVWATPAITHKVRLLTLDALFDDEKRKMNVIISTAPRKPKKHIRRRPLATTTAKRTNSPSGSQENDNENEDVQEQQQQQQQDSDIDADELVDGLGDDDEDPIGAHSSSNLLGIVFSRSDWSLNMTNNNNAENVENTNTMFNSTTTSEGMMRASSTSSSPSPNRRQQQTSSSPTNKSSNKYKLPQPMVCVAVGLTHFSLIDAVPEPNAPVVWCKSKYPPVLTTIEVGGELNVYDVTTKHHRQRKIPPTRAFRLVLPNFSMKNKFVRSTSQNNNSPSSQNNNKREYKQYDRVMRFSEPCVSVADISSTIVCLGFLTAEWVPALTESLQYAHEVPMDAATLSHHEHVDIAKDALVLAAARRKKKLQQQQSQSQSKKQQPREKSPEKEENIIKEEDVSNEISQRRYQMNQNSLLVVPANSGSYKLFAPTFIASTVAVLIQGNNNKNDEQQKSSSSSPSTQQQAGKEKEQKSSSSPPPELRTQTLIVSQIEIECCVAADFFCQEKMNTNIGQVEMKNEEEGKTIISISDIQASLMSNPLMQISLIEVDFLNHEGFTNVVNVVVSPKTHFPSPSSSSSSSTHSHSHHSHQHDDNNNNVHNNIDDDIRINAVDLINFVSALHLRMLEAKKMERQLQQQLHRRALRQEQKVLSQQQQRTESTSSTINATATTGEYSSSTTGQETTTPISLGMQGPQMSLRGISSNLRPRQPFKVINVDSTLRPFEFSLSVHAKISSELSLSLVDNLLPIAATKIRNVGLSVKIGKGGEEVDAQFTATASSMSIHSSATGFEPFLTNATLSTSMKMINTKKLQVAFDVSGAHLDLRWHHCPLLLWWSTQLVKLFFSHHEQHLRKQQQQRLLRTTRRSNNFNVNVNVNEKNSKQEKSSEQQQQQQQQQDNDDKQEEECNESDDEQEYQEEEEQEENETEILVADRTGLGFQLVGFGGISSSVIVPQFGQVSFLRETTRSGNKNRNFDHHHHHLLHSLDVDVIALGCKSSSSVDGGHRVSCPSIHPVPSFMPNEACALRINADILPFCTPIIRFRNGDKVAFLRVNRVGLNKILIELCPPVVIHNTLAMAQGADSKNLTNAISNVVVEKLVREQTFLKQTRTTTKNRKNLLLTNKISSSTNGDELLSAPILDDESFSENDIISFENKMNHNKVVAHSSPQIEGELRLSVAPHERRLHAGGVSSIPLSARSLAQLSCCSVLTNNVREKCRARFDLAFTRNKRHDEEEELILRNINNNNNNSNNNSPGKEKQQKEEEFLDKIIGNESDYQNQKPLFAFAELFTSGQETSILRIRPTLEIRNETGLPLRVVARRNNNEDNEDDDDNNGENSNNRKDFDEDQEDNYGNENEHYYYGQEDSETSSDSDEEDDIHHSQKHSQQQQKRNRKIRRQQQRKKRSNQIFDGLLRSSEDFVPQYPFWCSEKDAAAALPQHSDTATICSADPRYVTSLQVSVVASGRWKNSTTSMTSFVQGSLQNSISNNDENDTTNNFTKTSIPFYFPEIHTDDSGQVAEPPIQQIPLFGSGLGDISSSSSQNISNNKTGETTTTTTEEDSSSCCKIYGRWEQDGSVYVLSRTNPKSKNPGLAVVRNTLPSMISVFVGGNPNMSQQQHQENNNDNDDNNIITNNNDEIRSQWLEPGACCALSLTECMHSSSSNYSHNVNTTSSTSTSTSFSPSRFDKNSVWLFLPGFKPTRCDFFFSCKTATQVGQVYFVDLEPEASSFSQNEMNDNNTNTASSSTFSKTYTNQSQQQKQENQQQQNKPVGARIGIRCVAPGWFDLVPWAVLYSSQNDSSNSHKNTSNITSPQNQQQQQHPTLSVTVSNSNTSHNYYSYQQQQLQQEVAGFDSLWREETNHYLLLRYSETAQWYFSCAPEAPVCLAKAVQAHELGILPSAASCSYSSSASASASSSPTRRKTTTTTTTTTSVVLQQRVQASITTQHDVPIFHFSDFWWNTQPCRIAFRNLSSYHLRVEPLILSHDEPAVSSSPPISQQQNQSVSSSFANTTTNNNINSNDKTQVLPPRRCDLEICVPASITSFLITKAPSKHSHRHSHSHVHHHSHQNPVELFCSYNSSSHSYSVSMVQHGGGSGNNNNDEQQQRLQLNFFVVTNNATTGTGSSSSGTTTRQQGQQQQQTHYLYAVDAGCRVAAASSSVTQVSDRSDFLTNIFEPEFDLNVETSLRNFSAAIWASSIPETTVAEKLLSCSISRSIFLLRNRDQIKTVMTHETDAKRFEVNAEIREFSLREHEDAAVAERNHAFLAPVTISGRTILRFVELEEPAASSSSSRMKTNSNNNSSTSDNSQQTKTQQQHSILSRAPRPLGCIFHVVPLTISNIQGTAGFHLKERVELAFPLKTVLLQFRELNRVISRSSSLIGLISLNSTRFNSITSTTTLDNNSNSNNNAFVATSSTSISQHQHQQNPHHHHRNIKNKKVIKQQQTSRFLPSSPYSISSSSSYSSLLDNAPRVLPAAPPSPPPASSSSSASSQLSHLKAGVYISSADIVCYELAIGPVRCKVGVAKDLGYDEESQKQILAQSPSSARLYNKSSSSTTSSSSSSGASFESMMSQSSNVQELEFNYEPHTITTPNSPHSPEAGEGGGSYFDDSDSVSSGSDSEDEDENSNNNSEQQNFSQARRTRTTTKSTATTTRYQRGRHHHLYLKGVMHKHGMPLEVLAVSVAKHIVSASAGQVYRNIASVHEILGSPLGVVGQAFMSSFADIIARRTTSAGGGSYSSSSGSYVPVTAILPIFASEVVGRSMSAIANFASSLLSSPEPTTPHLMRIPSSAHFEALNEHFAGFPQSASFDLSLSSSSSSSGKERNGNGIRSPYSAVECAIKASIKDLLLCGNPSYILRVLPSAVAAARLKYCVLVSSSSPSHRKIPTNSTTTSLSFSSSSSSCWFSTDTTVFSSFANVTNNPESIAENEMSLCRILCTLTSSDKEILLKDENSFAEFISEVDPRACAKALVCSKTGDDDNNTSNSSNSGNKNKNYNVFDINNNNNNTTTENLAISLLGLRSAIIRWTSSSSSSSSNINTRQRQQQQVQVSHQLVVTFVERYCASICEEFDAMIMKRKHQFE